MEARGTAWRSTAPVLVLLMSVPILVLTGCMDWGPPVVGSDGDADADADGAQDADDGGDAGDVDAAVLSYALRSGSFVAGGGHGGSDAHWTLTVVGSPAPVGVSASERFILSNGLVTTRLR